MATEAAAADENQGVQFDNELVRFAPKLNSETDVVSLNESHGSFIDDLDDMNNLSNEDFEGASEESEASRKQKKKKKKKKETERELLSERSTILITDDYDDILRHDMKEEDVPSDSSCSDEIVYTRSGAQRPKMLLSNKFFTDFADMPSLSDISLTEEDELIPRIRETDPDIDVGHFVHPLSGEILKSSSSTSASDVNDGEIEEEQSEELMDDFPIAHTKEDDFNVVHFDLDGMEAFTAFKESLFLEGKRLPDEDEALKLHQIYKTITSDFLNKLIDDVVAEYEKFTEKQRLKASLDKKSIYAEIDSLIEEYYTETKKNKLYTKKIVDHFRRIKACDMIDTLDGKNTLYEKDKYDKQMGVVDALVLAINEFEMLQAQLIPSLTEELRTAEEEVKKADESLEKTIRSTLVRPNFKEMDAFIGSELKRMFRQRKAIDVERFRLYNRQHISAKLQEELTKLEYITDDLKISKYVSVQTECFSLEKKIEEKTLEVGRLFSNWNSSLHALAHMKEKQQTLTKKSDRKSKKIINILDEFRTKREQIFKCELEREKIRRELKTVSHAAGLLDRPFLLYDYDHIVADINNMKRIVLNLRNQLNECLSQVAKDNPKDSIIQHWKV